MKKTATFSGKLGGIGVVAMLVAASAFADSRHQEATTQAAWRDGVRGSSAVVVAAPRYERQNISVEGRITSITRERDGFRVQLDRGGYSFWTRDRSVASGRRGIGRVSDLRVGVSIRIGGIYEPRFGYVVADDIACIDEAGYRNDGYRNRDGYYVNTILRATVERVDDRRFLVFAHDESGRFVTIDLSRADRHRGVDVRDLRRGDQITLAGSWVRGDTFSADRIESYRAGRW